MCKGAFPNLLEEMSMYFGKNTETDVKVKIMLYRECLIYKYKMLISSKFLMWKGKNDRS